MIADLFLYKQRLFTIALLLGYTFIHLRLTGLYAELSLEGLVHFTAPLPYGQRLLLPAIVHFFSSSTPLHLATLFFFMEWLFISLFYFALFKLLQEEFNAREAQLLSWLFLLLLPLITVINYRYGRHGAAAIIHPSDTPTLFFVAVGYLFCLRAQWLFFVPWVFLATFNRESSILLVFLIPALYWQKKQKILLPTLCALLAYLAARFIILSFLSGVPGHLMDWYVSSNTMTLFVDNFLWLFAEEHIFLLLFCFAGLPLLWFVFFDYIPLRFRPLRYVIFFYFLGLMMIGRLMESRIFSEIVLLIYLPVCLALKRWLLALEPMQTEHSGVLYFLDRWAIIGAIFFIMVFASSLNSLVIWTASLLGQ